MVQPEDVSAGTGQRKVPRVSVVIPVYNSGQYLQECLERVQNQTLREIEVICVDDGSTDQSGEILRLTAETDSRFRVITKENGGASSARNVGAARAGGEYLYFLDSDDLLEENALERLYHYAKERRLDILFFDAGTLFETEELQKTQSSYASYYIRKGDYTEVRTGWEMFAAMVQAEEYRVAPWLQFLRREYYVNHGFSFVEGIVGEDNLFTYESLTKAERAGYLSDQLIRRRIRGGSVMTSQVTFHKVYSFYATYERLARELEQREDLTLWQQEALARVLDTRLKVARKLYHALPEDQKKEIGRMELRKRVAMLHLLEDPEASKREKALLAENQKLKKKIEKLEYFWPYRVYKKCRTVFGKK